ncbi:fibronectin type III domain-containing protein [Halobacteriovorax marinus]|nr:fibronectin type III domain-containing protein [Halobacteriovorax marinus]
MKSKESKFTFILLFLLLAISCAKKEQEDILENSQSNPINTSPEVSVAIASINEPINGTYGEGGELIFQIIYEEIIQVTGTPRISLNIGGVSSYATYVSGSGTNGIEFKYTISSGDNDIDGISLNSSSIDLNSGEMKNSDGDNAQLDLSSDIDSLNSVLVDTTNSPPDKVTGVTTAPTTSNTSLGVAWTVPNDNGIDISAYSIQYREAGTSNWTNTSSSTNSKTLTGLSSGTTYEIRVAASNGVLGAYSTIVTTEIFDILSLNPIAWLSATDISNGGAQPSHGDKIDQWEDLTGLATAATETNVAKQPVFHENVFNGLPAVRFDDLDRGLEGTFVRTNNGGLTLITVGKMDTNTSRKCFFEFYQEGSANSGNDARRGFFFTYGYNSAGINANLDDTSFNIWTATDSGTQSSQWENGVNLYTDRNNYFPRTDFLGNGVYVLGDDKTGGDRLNGYIGEFLIFDKILSDEERTKVETYLKNKWGL